MSATGPISFADLGDALISGVARGDLIYRGAAAWQNLAIAGVGNYVRSNGTDPAWSAILDADLPATIVRTSRSVSTTAPLTGGGDLSANRTLAIPKATAGVDGYLAAADFGTFNGKEPALGNPGSDGQVLQSTAAGARSWTTIPASPWSRASGIISPTTTTDRVLIPAAIPASANFGLLSLGDGPFDGSTTGKFVGHASGSGIALNAASGYTGELFHFAIAGVPYVRHKKVGVTDYGVEASGGGFTAFLGSNGSVGAYVGVSLGATIGVGLCFLNAGPDVSPVTAGALLNNGADLGRAAARWRSIYVATSLDLKGGTNIILDATTGTKIGTATTQRIGFWNAAPVTQPTVTGSRGGNAALASLLTQLATMGLVVDSTTA